MRFRHLFIINAIIAFIYGIGELLIPATMFAMYGVAYSPGAPLMAQYFGLTLIAISLLSWLARNISDVSAKRVIIMALLVSDVIGVVVSVMGTLTGLMSIVGWSAVVIYLFLTLGYGYFLVVRSVVPAKEFA
ncbi:MAG: hypothetical protein P8184_18165 [Calditrichia bacterium]